MQAGHVMREGLLELAGAGSPLPELVLTVLGNMSQITREAASSFARQIPSTIRSHRFHGYSCIFVRAFPVG